MRLVLAALVIACAALAGCSPPPGPGTSPADLQVVPTTVTPDGSEAPLAGPFYGTTGPYYGTN